MTDSSVFSILRHLPSETARILKLSKKPTKSEFEDVIKITGVGILILGAIGLAFLIIKVFLKGRI